ncbi:hypothetical protein WICPIJ_008836 [Wickerhamomyces pijperi]|uniref:PQ-loop repeat-containing protein 1 n=1 Tax=Wickerhamomyces pijperi TaxID=599730 RepID=A0A9P8TGB5_WICPI|nr:hypothetical protein WICPIJ_008836 [Wickerhamomyces pijperi]
MSDSYYDQLTSFLPPSTNSIFPEWITIPYLFQQIITITPLLSYGSTIHSIHKNKSTLGFSLDICLTMIVASSCRLSYFMFGGFHDVGLVRQAAVMVCVQFVVLYVALKYHDDKLEGEKFTDELDYWLEFRLSYQELKEFQWSDLSDSLTRLSVILHDFVKLNLLKFVRLFDPNYHRPFQFWQWPTTSTTAAAGFLEISPYWKTIAYIELSIILTTFLFRGQLPFLGTIIGTFGLFIESLLPLPQILLLLKLQSIKGFKLMLLVSWICGDFTKISYLMFGEGDKGPLFMIFAMWQMALDFYIGYLYVWFKFFKEDSINVDLTGSAGLELKDLHREQLHRKV